MFTIFFGSLVSMGLWYCFDDQLARLTGVDDLGQVPWTNVWAATAMISVLLSMARPTIWWTKRVEAKKG